MKTLTATALIAMPLVHVPVFGQAPPAIARPLPLAAVRLTGGPLKHAQDLDASYLLGLETDRLVAGYRIRAGLPTNAKGYGGWDSVEGKQLTGHIAGHYLSGVSLMYATTGDERFKRRAVELTGALGQVAEKRGTGYLGAMTDAAGRDAADIFERDVANGNIKSGGFDLNGMWAPWYVFHKTFAGLRDAYRHCGIREALKLEIGFAGWTERVLSKLDDRQIQQMLNCEFGGMNEVLVDLFADTGDRRWLDLSRKFEHLAVTGGLKERRDILPGKHGNTQIPKLIGSMDRYTVTGDAADLTAAEFFWDRVVHHHSYATGGHGKDEYFGEPDHHHDRIDGRTAESCNVYNMLKLTRRLFSWKPDAGFADFHERALFNHVLGSIDPRDGSTCYMVPVGRGVEREYADMHESFTCCVGSGMESHALHADGIYYESGDRLWVNLYAQTTARWKEMGVTLEATTAFPMGTDASLRLKLDAPREFTMMLRKPGWCEGFSVSINGKPVPEAAVSAPAIPGGGSFVSIKRKWRDGDAIVVALPKTLRVEPLPDSPNRVALLWGPLVLAGEIGRGRDGSLEVPVFVAAGRPVGEWLKPVPGREGVFRTEGVGRERDVELTPFYQLQRRRYAAYWDLYTPDGWKAKSAEIAKERKRQEELVAATVAYMQPGEMQPERDFKFKGEGTSPDRVMGRACRRGAGWFSLEIPVDSSQPMALVVTYNRDEWRDRTFDILLDGERLAAQSIKARGAPGFFDETYPIPAKRIAGKRSVAVKFQATGGNEIAGVFGIRMVRVGHQARVERINPPQDGFFSKRLDYRGIPIKAHQVVSDAALTEARDRLAMLLEHQPSLADRLAAAGAELHIIGKDQVTTDLPDWRHDKGKPIAEYGGLTRDERTRGMGGLHASCGEENLLRLEKDVYRGRDICVHEFAHTIRSHAMDDNLRKRFDDQWRKSLAAKRWVGSYAASNPDEFFAELTMWYCGTHGDLNMKGDKPAPGKEGLKAYDPEAFELFDAFYSGRL
ncbi:MAG: glycoside hydrolase family 127 protein [Verrucomicrobia bacterium]|nr:glycoside hydrolase family 127 protein [Verrucomicrobiota bacterium]